MRPLMILVLALLTACAQGDDTEPVITITAVVPEGTGEVYIAGNLDSLGRWDADGLLMSGEGTSREAALTMPEGFEFQYKFTLGTWEREAVDKNGFPLPNFALTAADGLTAEHEIAAFKPERSQLLEDWKGSGVIGTLIYWRDVESQFLGPLRHVEIWLPPGYHDPENAEKRYPVIYMTDGENLFDPRIANTGIDWGIDEAMMRGAERGAFEPAIVVAHWSTRKRLLEYSPWHEGPELARFVIEELKPRVDEEFRTLTGRNSTFAMGSSMGGLNAMYLVTQHPNVFSACGCVSTHIPLSESVVAEVLDQTTRGADEVPYLTRDIEAARFAIPEGARLFFDYGTATLDEMYPEPHQALKRWLTEQGYEDGEDFLFREYPGAEHNEAAWRSRVEDQLVWLLAGDVP